jgi:WD40 repeat protein
MKLSIATTKTALASIAISLVSYPIGAAAAASCTHGKLFVSSIDDTTVRVFDLNSGLDNVALDYSVDVSEAGPELNLAKDTSSTVVAVIYRGTEENLYQVGARLRKDTDAE